MKPTQYKKWLVLALALVNGLFAGAQSNGVPGPTAYSSFSRFITERNIFDPNRYPRNSSSTRSTYRPRAIALDADVHAGRHDELRKGDVRVF